MQADVPLLVTGLESEFRSNENLSPVFVLNSEGVLTDMVLTELGARQSMRGEDPFPVSTCWVSSLTIIDWLDEAACIERIDMADYVLLEDFSTGFFPPWIEDSQRIEAILQYLEGALPEFVVFGEAPNSEFRPDTPGMNSSGFLRGRFLMLKRKAK